MRHKYDHPGPDISTPGIHLTLSALALIALSSIAWAGFDATRKALTERYAVLQVGAAVMLAQVPAFVLWAIAIDAPIPSRGYFAPGAASALLNVASNFLFLRALQLSPLSATIPFLSFSPLFTVLVAIPLLGELPEPLQLIGMAIIVVGALLVNAGDDDALNLRLLFRRLVDERGSVLILAVAMLWAISTSVDKLALEHATPPIHAAVQSGAVGVAFTGYLVYRRELTFRWLGPATPTLLLALLSSVVALGAQLYALQLTYVSIVEAMKRAFGMTLSVVNGRVFFAEKVTRRRIIAVVFMSVGVALVLLP